MTLSPVPLGQNWDHRNWAIAVKVISVPLFEKYHKEGCKWDLHIPGADILWRPVAFDLFSLFKSEKTFKKTPGGRTELKTLACAGDVPLINITIWRINITAKFWNDSSKMIIKFVRKLGWVGYWYSIYFQRYYRCFHRFTLTKFIDSLPGLP